MKKNTKKNTDKKNLVTLCLLLLFLFFNIGNKVYGQYSETFSIPEKGILGGVCSDGTSATCASQDFTGVN